MSLRDMQINNNYQKTLNTKVHNKTQNLSCKNNDSTVVNTNYKTVKTNNFRDKKISRNKERDYDRMKKYMK